MQDKPIRAMIALLAVLFIIGCMKASQAAGKFLAPDAKITAAY